MLQHFELGQSNDLVVGKIVKDNVEFQDRQKDVNLEIEQKQKARMQSGNALTEEA